MAEQTLALHEDGGVAGEDPVLHTDFKKFSYSTNPSRVDGVMKEGTIEDATDAVEAKKLRDGEGGCIVDAEIMAQIRNETAAVEVQRLYRGYRARRCIADAATIAHRFGWWNVVEGALLECQSSLYYAYHSPQSAAQRWMRLKKKAAKLGRGLSKNEKARKLALQHWLEAIDPRHRYGHNLHFYYEKWSRSQTQEPFFYWLDIGEGKDSDVKECKRSKLQKDLIRYMSPGERQYYEVIIVDGKLTFKMTRELVNTPKGDKWIFVMSTSGKLYVGKKEKGRLQHSSFLAGGCTTAAGRLLVIDGVIELMEAHSGHYLPVAENFHELIRILTKGGADLTVAKMQFVSDDLLSSKSLIPDEAVKVEVEDVQNELVNELNFAGQEGTCATAGDEEPAFSVENVNEVQDERLPDEEKPSNVEKVTGIEDVQNTGDNRVVKDEDADLIRNSQATPDQSYNARDDSKDIPDDGLEDSMFELHEIPIPQDVHMPPNPVVKEDVQESVATVAPAKLSRNLSSQQRLFAAAVLTFSQLEGRTWTLKDANKPRSSAELPTNVKLRLLSMLSVNRSLAVS